MKNLQEERLCKKEDGVKCTLSYSVMMIMMMIKLMMIMTIFQEVERLCKKEKEGAKASLSRSVIFVVMLDNPTCS